jgi:hypothetical protein
VRLFNYIYGSAYKAEKKIKCSFLPRCIIGSECFTDENKTGIRLKHNEGLKTHKTSFITAARGKIQNEEKKQSSYNFFHLEQTQIKKFVGKSGEKFSLFFRLAKLSPWVCP